MLHRGPILYTNINIMILCIYMFSHYADKNAPQPRVLHIAAGTVSGVLLIVTIVTTVAIVVCCKKCILTKANLCKCLSPSTAAMDPENVNAEGTSVQEPQVEQVREHHTVYINVCVPISQQQLSTRSIHSHTSFVLF